MLPTLNAARRRRRRVVAGSCALVLVTALTACGDDEPTAELGPSASTSSTPAAETPSADETPSAAETEAEITAALDGYFPAVIAMNDRLGRGNDLNPFTTREWREAVLANYDDNFFSQGQQAVGAWKVVVDSIDVEGPTARATICLDGTGVYLVEIGERVQSGSRGQDRAETVITLQQADGGWKVDNSERTGEGC